MRVIVITPPDPFIVPSDVPGSHDADDAMVSAWISAAQAEIDGPNGMLGKAIGEQTLELQLDSFPCWPGRYYDTFIRLPCPPIIEVISVSYTDAEGAEVVLETSEWTWQPGTNKIYPAINTVWPATLRRGETVRVRYRAGYDGESFDEGGTGEIPIAIKQAVVLLVNHYKSTGAENLFLSSVTVDGVGSHSYVVSDAPARATRMAVENLLRGFKENPL